jgi:hypothetical protein
MASKTKNNAWKNLTTRQRGMLRATAKRRWAITKHMKEKITCLSAQLAAREKVVADTQAAMEKVNKSMAELEIRLLEARRRTLPFGTGIGPTQNDINFLPLCVLEATSEYETCHMRGFSGFGQQAVKGARFVLKVLAAVDGDNAPVQQMG